MTRVLPHVSKEDLYVLADNSHREGGGCCMANNNNPVSRTDRQQLNLPTPSRYDLQLGVIPVAFTVALLIGILSAVPMYIALAVGSLVGIGVMIDGLFRNPPLTTDF